MFRRRRKETKASTLAEQLENKSKNAAQDQLQKLDPKRLAALLSLLEPSTGENLKLKENSLLLFSRTGVVVRRVIDRDTSERVLKAVRLQFTRRLFVEFKLAEILTSFKQQDTNGAKAIKPVLEQIETVE